MASDDTGISAQARSARGGRTRRVVPGAAAPRWMAAVAGLAVTATLAAPVSAAHAQPAQPAKPKPSAKQAEAKLTKLNEQVEDLVEKYNQVSEDLKAAKKKLEAAKKAGRSELAAFDEQRARVAQMAANAYKKGDTGGVAGFVGTGDPQAVLDQQAVFTLLQQNRSDDLSQFLATAQRLRREQAQALAAYNEVRTKAKEMREKKAEVEKSIKDQKKLLAKLGEKEDKPGTGGTGGGTGGSYNGPASGSARAALNYAYAQLGKPYVYGGTGPGGYDCSGLTMRSWGAAGVNITRTTNSQWAATKHIDKSALQPGDLVFFRSLGHVGMYVGGGRMIHAPRTGKNVEIVSITSGYYLSTYYGASRP
ncbi:C40 family peptidase [Actinomadura hibisca]|uniref:C40 family peptidase n=1 Tax=Actinomadura hibisca TaxID=68565 RepID=UPI0009FE7967|nr:C40 family peptidase [Actinomadura hibisca]